MEPTSVQMPPSPYDVRESTRLLLRLAGRLGFSDEECPGFPVDDQVDLFGRLVKAREAAGLSVREFLQLNHRALVDFCGKYAVTRSEVRFGQAMVARVWAEWRFRKCLQQVVRERNRRSLQ
jgi:hypothetical protein